MAVASMLVSTRWLEYLTQLDQDETSKRDQPLVRLFSPVSGSQIVESDEKWRVMKNGERRKKHRKKGKEQGRKSSPPSPAQENDRLERFC